MKSLLPKFSLKKSCHLLLVFTVLGGSFFIVTPAFAANGINNQINFQGKLVDANGLNVADNTYTVVFSLYSVSSGGAAIWTESDSVTTTAGIFQVSLGANTSLPGNVNFNSDTLYLGIKVGADAEMTPRIRFTAVPYAFNAAALDGVVATQSASGFTLTGGTSTLKTLTLNDNTTFNTAGLTFANGKSLGLSNSLTFAGTDGTTFTLPGSSGTVVTTDAIQTLTNKTIGSTGLTFSGASTDVTTGTNEDFTLSPNGSGYVVVNADADTGLKIGSSTNTAALLSISGGIGSNASLIVNNNNSGDLFVASQAGSTKFRIANNGDAVLTAGINLGGSVGTGSQCLLGGATAAWGSCSAGSNYLRLNAGAFSLVNDTADFLFGNSASTSAKFKLSASGTSPTASVAAATSYAGLVVDQSGTGDLFAASTSGTTKFYINGSGTAFASGLDGFPAVSTGGTPATITHVQSTGNFAGTGSTSIAQAFGSNNTAGNFIVVAVTFDSFSAASVTCSDSQGNSYGTQIVQNDTTDNQELVVCYAANIKAGANTVTATFNASTSSRGIAIHEYSGVATTSPLDTSASQNAVATTSTDAVTSTASTTTNNGDLIFGVVFDNDSTNTISAGTGFTQRQSISSAFQTQDKTQASAGSVANTNTFSATHRYNSIMAAFKPQITGSSPGTSVLSLGTANATKINIGSALASTMVGINNTNPLATFDVRGTFASSPVASFSGTTSAASMVVDQSGTGDLFTASKSGATKFVINNAGNVGIGTATPNALLDIARAFNGSTNVNITNTNNGSGAYSYYQAVADNNAQIQFGMGSSGTTANIFNNRAFVYANSNANGISFVAEGTNKDIRFFAGASAGGSVGTADEKLRISGIGTVATASVSANTSYAGLVIDNSGTGDIFTASTAGRTRFRMDDSGSVLFQGDMITSIGSLGSAGTATQTNQSAVINAIGDQGSMVPNAGFESNLTVTKTGNTADPVISDGWVAAATASANVLRIATDSAKGTSSMLVKLNNGQSTAFYSACIPVALGNANLGAYNVMFYAKGSVAIPVVRGYLDGYTSKANCQSNTSPLVSAAQGAAITTAWAKYGGTSAISNLANDTWARAHIFVGCPAAGCGTAATVEIDAVRVIESSLTGGVDYAENYPADPNNMAEPGDVVSIVASGSASIVKKADRYMDTSAIGVVSTNPGETLDDGSMGDAKVPVALAGRIPTKVSTQNGAIHVGDYLTASTIPGVAVKAINAGQVIGQAMEEYDESDPTAIGKVVMFVKNTYYNGIPLNYGSGLTQDHAQGDLEFLGQLVNAAQKTASTSSSLNTISADRVVAGLDVIAPKVTTDVLGVNTIKSASQSGITIQLGSGKELQIGDASAGIRFDAQGNAFFAGTITADKIKVNGLEMLEERIKHQESNIASLSALVASSSSVTTTPSVGSGQIPSMDSVSTTPSIEPTTDREASMAAILAKYDTNLFNIQALSVADDATISGSLRVKGNSLVEGVLHVVDTLTAGNLVVNQMADFFGNTIFHGAVSFTNTPTFNKDTAGYVTVKKDSDSVDVTYSKEYPTVPVVNATAVSTKLTNEMADQYRSEGVCREDQDLESCQKTVDEALLKDQLPFLITNSSPKGFVIKLEHSAPMDIQFSWTAWLVEK